MKRLTAIILMLTLASGMFAGCSQTPEQAKDDNQTTTTESEITAEAAEISEAAQEEEKVNPYLDELDPSLNFDGEEVRFYSRSHFRFADEVTVEEKTGEIVNDAIYDRQTRVEDKLNIKITNTYDSGANHGSVDAMNKLITAGSDDFDIFTASMYTLTPAALKGGYYDWYEIPNVDTTKAYYTQDYNEKASWGGHLFTLTGDISLSLIRYSFCMYFNKTLVDQFGIENPYEMVREGTWTYDKLKSIVSGVYTDTNGNSEYDDADLYGLGTSDVIIIDAYTSAFDMHMMSKDERDYPYYDLNLEKWADCVTKLWNLNHETEGVSVYIEYSDNNEMTDLLVTFAQDKLLFINNWIYGSESDYMRSMESDYGIIPYPKYDEAQENYYTFQHDQIGVFGIPVTSTRLAVAGAAFEALSSESRVSVVPAYYDIALKGKYARDEDSKTMIDIIHNGHLLDPAWIYCSNLGDLAQSPRNLLKGGNSNFASFYASKERAYEKGLGVLIKIYEKSHS